jgi:DNA-binding transcriptional LysR family regulator
MDKFHLMTVFVAVAEEESFAGAARKLGMSPPAVTRAVAALEERLKSKLLNRTTRFVRATDAGLRYLEHARRIIAEVDEAEEVVSGVNAEPSGQLTITAPVLFGRMFVLPGILEYQRRYPDVTVNAVFLDRVVNLFEEGIDVGLRIGELPDSSLKAIGVGQVRQVVCASPEYFKTYGVPKIPTDLSGHNIIVASAVTPSLDWRFYSGKKMIRVKIKPQLTVTNNEAAIVAAIDGFGMTRLLSYQTAPYVASEQLKLVLSEYEPPHLPIHVLHREGRQVSAKVRTFVDLVVERLRADKALR